MEKIFATKGENRRLRALFSNLWNCGVEDIVEANKTEKKMNWKQYERYKARKHRGRHVGGPGREDYRRGSVKGEVKHMKRSMTKPEVIRAAKKGITEISALGGYTEPAKEYARRHEMRLFYRGRRVV